VDHFGAHFRAFYKGLFGGGGSVNTIYNGYNDPMNVFMTQIDVPNIWGGSSSFAESAASEAIATNLPVIRARQNIVSTPFLRQLLLEGFHY
jgi:hypothetical protein